MPDRTKLTDRDLRSMLGEAPANRNDCPSSDELSAMLEAEGLSLRARWADHVASCASCGEELRIGLELRRELGVDPAVVSAPSGRTSFAGGWARFRLPQLAVSLAMLGVVAVGALVVRERLTAPSVVRGDGAVRLDVEPADGERLSVAPRALFRRGGSPSSRWRVLLFDADSTPLWESPMVSGSSIELPAELRARLAGRIYWRIVELDGARESRSKLLRFDVGP